MANHLDARHSLFPVSSMLNGPISEPVLEKRKLDYHVDSATKRRKTNNPFDYSSEAFKRWRARRVKEPAADVFAATTLRAEAHKLKRLPLEIRRIIYEKLLCWENGYILVDKVPDKPVMPLVFCAAGRGLEWAHYFNPKYVGDQIAAEAEEAFWENNHFEFDLKDLSCLSQPCHFLPGVNPAALIRGLVVRTDRTRHYTSSNMNEDPINAADWIELSGEPDSHPKHLDDGPYPFLPSGEPSASDSSARAWKWRKDRDRWRSERAGLNVLCRMPKLRSVKLEIHVKGYKGPDLRPLIPAVRRLKEKGIAVTVIIVPSIGDSTWTPKDADITNMFSNPSSDDEGFAATQGLLTLVTHLHWQHLQSPSALHDLRWSSKPTMICSHTWANCRCMRVEINRLYEELKQRIQSNQSLPQSKLVEGPPDEERTYGSSPPPEAEQWAIAVEEAHAADSQATEVPDDEGIYISSTPSDSLDVEEILYLEQQNEFNLSMDP